MKTKIAGEANARLIAAAPELLEALKARIQLVDTRVGDCNVHPDLIRDAAQAIAKAEGQ